MRCECCNKILTPQEATRKFKLSGTYTDTCSTCLATMDVATIDSDNEYEELDYSDNSLEDGE